MVLMTQREPMAGLMLYQLENHAGPTFYNQLLRRPELPGPEATPEPWAPVVEVLEEADALRVVAELPGVQPKDVRVWLEGRRLTIAGTKAPADAEPAVKVLRDERTYGVFKRSFGLSTVVDFTNVVATYDLGVLTIRLPKADSAKRRQIPITSSGPVAVEIPVTA